MYVCVRACVRFEEEAATSTMSVIHQWKALVKPEIWTLLLRTKDEFLNLYSRSTEILVPKQAYRVRTGAKYDVLFRPLEQTWCDILLTYDD